MKEPFKITELWALVSQDKKGEEGVCGFHGRDGVFWPMVCADVARLRSYIPIAEEISKESGMKIEVRRFTTMETLTVITPEGITHL
jgi:hypothetical protein